MKLTGISTAKILLFLWKFHEATYMWKLHYCSSPRLLHASFLGCTTHYRLSWYTVWMIKVDNRGPNSEQSRDLHTHATKVTCSGLFLTLFTCMDHVHCSCSLFHNFCSMCISIPSYIDLKKIEQLLLLYYYHRDLFHHCL